MFPATSVRSRRPHPPLLHACRSLLDLLSFLPFYIELIILTGEGKSDVSQAGQTRIIRILRLFRLLRLVKLGKR